MPPLRLARRRSGSDRGQPPPQRAWVRNAANAVRSVWEPVAGAVAARRRRQSAPSADHEEEEIVALDLSGGTADVERELSAMLGECEDEPPRAAEPPTAAEQAAPQMAGASLLPGLAPPHGVSPDGGLPAGVEQSGEEGADVALEFMRYLHDFVRRSAADGGDRPRQGDEQESEEPAFVHVGVLPALARGARAAEAEAEAGAGQVEGGEGEASAAEEFGNALREIVSALPASLLGATILIVEGRSSSTALAFIAPLPSRDLTYEEMMELQELIGNHEKGLTREQIDAIPCQSFTKRGGCTGNSSEEVCTICLSEYELDDAQRVMRCGHVFHRECVDVWLGDHNSCPLCKHEAIVIEPEPEQ